MLQPLPLVEWNALELLLVALAILGVIGTGVRLGWSVRGRLVAALLLSPVLLLAAVEATQFMTTDEYAITVELLDPAKRASSQIEYGAYVTGLALQLPLVHVAELAGIADAKIRMLLKAFWWLLGTGLTMLIAVRVIRLARVAVEPASFVMVFVAIFLLPTTQAAIKSLNYDLISLTCGLLAVLLILEVLLGHGGVRQAWLAVIAAALGAQEKATASPILVLAILVVALTSRAEGDQPRARARAAATAAAMAILAAVALTTVFRAIYWVLGPPTGKSALWWTVLDPIAVWMWVPLRQFLPVEVLTKGTVRLFLGAAMLGAIVGVAAQLARVLNWSARIPPFAAASRVRTINMSAAGVVVGLYVTGIIAASTVQAYWAPYHPLRLAELEWVQKLNGVVLHTDAASLAGHYVELLAYAAEILVVAIPSALWILALIGIAVWMLAGRMHVSANTGKIVLILMSGAVVVPLGAIIAQVPFAHRYFNVSITLIAVALLLIGLRALAPRGDERRDFVRWTAAVALVTALLVEVAPFRPLFAAYRPLWLTYADSDRVERGRLNASWMGWGEEVLKAGKTLEAECSLSESNATGIRCEDITLYVMYTGLWLPGPSRIRVSLVRGPKFVFPMDEKSYFLTNRSYWIQQEHRRMPDIPAEFTISHRGYTMAWVYRGDRLAAAGFRFDR